MRLVLILFLIFNFLYAYQSEDDIKVAIIGKIAKFITWEDNSCDKFVITILNNKFGDRFDKKYFGKKIQGKSVEIKYIDNIKELKFTHILYIVKTSSTNLLDIFTEIRDKDIITISDTRAFAQRGGDIQIYFVAQKGRIAMNLSTFKKGKMKVKSSLARIAKIVKGAPF